MKQRVFLSGTRARKLLSRVAFLAIIGAVLAALTGCPQSTAGVGPTTTPTAPAIGLSSTTLSFAATQGGANPASQSVTVTNTGAGTLNGLSASVSYATGSGWLTPTVGAAAPTTLSVRPTTGTLVAGTYTATVSVLSGVASNSPQNVTVTFTVAPPSPSIGLSANSLSFTAVAGGANPAAQTVNVTNSGVGTLNGLSASVSYTAGSGWLTPTVGAAAPTTLSVQPTTGALAAGTYTATVSVTSGVANNSPQNVSVTFTVTPPPAIGLSSHSLSFTATQGGANPAPQTVNVTNTGGGTLNGLSASVSYTTGSGWLTPTVGAAAPTTLSVQPTTGALAAGTYTATVPVLSGIASNSPQTVAVTFIVSPPSPSIGLSTNSLSFTAVQGGANPAPQTVNVTNTGTGTLNGLSASTSYMTGSGWLTPTVGAAAPTTLSVQPTTGTLAPGAYSASVSVISGVANNSPQNVSVSFTITPLAASSITATATSTTQITLAWSAVTGATSYNLYRSTTSGFTIGPSTKIVTAPGTGYNDTGLTIGTTYYYKVTAVNSAGESTNVSNQAQALTAPYISAFVVVNAADGSSLQEYVLVSDGINGPISNGTVTMNGNAFSYNSGLHYYTPAAPFTILPGAAVNLSVTISSAVYTASTNQFSTYPSLTSGTTSPTGSPYTVTWSAGAPVTAADNYAAGIQDKTSAWVLGTSTGPNFYSSGTLSAVSPVLTSGSSPYTVWVGVVNASNYVNGTGFTSYATTIPNTLASGSLPSYLLVGAVSQTALAVQ